MSNMVKTIDMQDLMNLNLFEKITKVRTNFCFKYNDVIYFCVPQTMLKKALGKDAENLKNISYKIRRRVRIIAVPNGPKDIKKFIQAVVAPVEVNEISVDGNEIKITGTRMTKASLIGRNKCKLIELQKIVKDFFGKDLKVI